jgi:hypothetical protein
MMPLSDSCPLTVVGGDSVSYLGRKMIELFAG